MIKHRRQSEDGILGAFQVAGLILAFGLLFQPIRDVILFSGAAGIGFSTFILLGATVIAIYRFITMQLHRFPRNPAPRETERELDWGSISSAS
jgi:hypothetical protein